MNPDKEPLPPSYPNVAIATQHQYHEGSSGGAPGNRSEYLEATIAAPRFCFQTGSLKINNCSSGFQNDEYLRKQGLHCATDKIQKVATTTRTSPRLLVPVFDENQKVQALVYDKTEAPNAAKVTPAPPKQRRGRKRPKKNEAVAPAPATLENNIVTFPTANLTKSFELISQSDIVLGDQQARDDRTTPATKLARDIKEAYRTEYKGRPKALWLSLAIQEIKVQVSEQFPSENASQLSPGRVLLRCTNHVMKAGRVSESNKNKYGFAKDTKANYGLAVSDDEELEKFLSSRDSPDLSKEITWYRQYLQRMQKEQHHKLEPLVDRLLDKFAVRLRFFEELLYQAQTEKDKDAELFLKDLSPINPLKNLWERLDKGIEKARQCPQHEPCATRGPTLKPPPAPDKLTVTTNRKFNKDNSVKQQGFPTAAVPGSLNPNTFLYAPELAEEKTENTANDKLSTTEKTFEVDIKTFEGGIENEFGHLGDDTSLDNFRTKFLQEMAGWCNEMELKDDGPESLSNTNLFGSTDQTIITVSVADMHMDQESDVEEPDTRSLTRELDAVANDSLFLLEIQSCASALSQLSGSYFMASIDDGVETRLGDLTDDMSVQSHNSVGSLGTPTITSKIFEPECVQPSPNCPADSRNPNVGYNFIIKEDELAAVGNHRQQEPEREDMHLYPAAKPDDPPGFSPDEGSQYQSFLADAGRALSVDNHLQRSIKHSISDRQKGNGGRLEPPEDGSVQSGHNDTCQVSNLCPNIPIELSTTVAAYVPHEDEITSRQIENTVVTRAVHREWPTRSVFVDLPSAIDYKDQGRDFHDVCGAAVVAEPVLQTNSRRPSPSQMSPSLAEWKDPSPGYVISADGPRACNEKHASTREARKRQWRLNLLLCIWPRARRSARDPRARSPTASHVPVDLSAYELSEVVALAPPALQQTRSSRATRGLPSLMERSFESGSVSSMDSERASRAPADFKEEVEVTVIRPKLRMSQEIGIKFGIASQGLCITKIETDSIFEGSELSEGMIIRSINGLEDLSKKEAEVLVKRIKGNVTITAMGTPRVGQRVQRASSSPAVLDDSPVPTNIVSPESDASRPRSSTVSSVVDIGDGRRHVSFAASTKDVAERAIHPQATNCKSPRYSATPPEPQTKSEVTDSTPVNPSRRPWCGVRGIANAFRSDRGRKGRMPSRSRSASSSTTLTDPSQTRTTLEGSTRAHMLEGELQTRCSLHG